MPKRKTFFSLSRQICSVLYLLMNLKILVNLSKAANTKMQIQLKSLRDLYNSAPIRSVKHNLTLKSRKMLKVGIEN